MMKWRTKVNVDGAKTTLQEFRSFALKANAVDLAIGVAIGAAFNAVVNSIVTGLMTPIIGAVFGEKDFAGLFFSIRGSQFHYGLFINAIISMFIVALVLFFFVVKPLNARRRRTGQESTPTTAPCIACTTEISRSATRCPACTEALGADWSQAKD